MQTKLISDIKKNNMIICLNNRKIMEVLPLYL